MSALARIHPSAIVEDDVVIGEGTVLWDGVHVRGPSRIGTNCIVGEKTYIAYDVEVGDKVKINAHVYICAGVRIDRGVMISAGAVFTNDRFPRATDPDLSALRSSEPDEATMAASVAEGATIGAGAVIGPGLEIGRWAMVGMGSVVTRSVPDFYLVYGNPARYAGLVCRCGHILSQEAVAGLPEIVQCRECERSYSVSSGLVEEL